jgi:hypothetical protein
MWEQEKEEDEGLESFVRKWIEKEEITWCPVNKAIRLAEHQQKGDVNRL